MEINHGYTTMHGQPTIKIILIVCTVAVTDVAVELVIGIWVIVSST
jgi:hypothetical protein